MLLALLLVLACAVAPPPELDDCAGEANAELAILCRTEAANAAGRAGDPLAVDRICALQPAGSWRSECHYRGAEGLGWAGLLTDAMQGCLLAGDYADMCAVHVAWVEGPGWQDLASEDGVGQLLATVPAPAAAEHQLRHAAWLDRIYGTGLADPAVARAAARPDTVAARSAWAFEAVRLQLEQGPVVPELVLAAWEQGLVLTGPALVRSERRLRLPGELRLPEDHVLPTVPWFLDQERLRGQTEREDLLIASLWAAFSLGAPAAAYQPWLQVAQERLRWTAQVLATASGVRVEATDPTSAQLLAEARRASPASWTAPPADR